MNFSYIDLKPISSMVLSFLYGKEPLKASDIAESLNLKTRQVDAAVTKSLVRYGFCVREYRLTRLLKKEYALIKLTAKGEQYLQWLEEKKKNERRKQDEITSN